MTDQTPLSPASGRRRNSPARPRPSEAWLRSALSVLVGVVTAAVLVLLLTTAAVFVFFEGDFAAPPTPTYLVLNLAYSALAAGVGGWLAAWMARHRPVVHSLGVAGVMLIPAVIGLVAGSGETGNVGVSSWYGMLLSVLGPVGAVLGGVLRARWSGRSTAPTAVAGTEGIS